MSPHTRMNHIKIPATIVEKPTQANSYYYVVAAKDNPERKFYLSGLGCPFGGEVGDEGFVQYNSSTWYGLYMWTPNKSKTLKKG